MVNDLMPYPRRGGKEASDKRLKLAERQQVGRDARKSIAKRPRIGHPHILTGRAIGGKPSVAVVVIGFGFAPAGFE